MRCGVITTIALSTIALLSSGVAQSAILTENFDETPSGFFGTTGKPGNLPSVPVVPDGACRITARSLEPKAAKRIGGIGSSQAGSGYALVNANSTTDQNISNWLITPVISFNAGDSISFWTRTLAPVQFCGSASTASEHQRRQHQRRQHRSVVRRLQHNAARHHPNQTLVGYPASGTGDGDVRHRRHGRLAFRIS